MGKGRQKMKLIDGRTSVGKPCGYCYFKGHEGYLDEHTIRTKCCIAKCCQYLELYEEHEYWQKLASKKKTQLLKFYRRLRKKGFISKKEYKSVYGKVVSTK